MRRLIALIMLAATLSSLAACAVAQPQRAASPVEAPAPAAQPPQEMAAAEAESGTMNDSVAGGTTSFVQEPIAADRKIIYRADMSLVVQNTEQTVQQIQALVADVGGYVANSQLSQYSNDLMRGYMVVRVPVESFEDVMAQLRSLALRVLNESSNAEDVTAEYTDLEAQLRNLEAAEQELLALLTDVRERPNAKAEDILEVFNALSEKRGQIEQVKGRMQYLANLIALSTITINLVPDELGKPVVEEGWQPLVTLKSAFRTLVNLLQGLVDLLINFVVVVLPVLIIIALPIVALVLLIRWLIKRRRR